jgi:SAM-dependent methyltransferase
MQPSDVASSYDQIAALWNSAEFPRTNGIPQHERALAFVKEKRRAIDLGCGCNGRIIDLLLRHGFHVEGVDISAQMIALAQERHPGLTFHHADVCRWEFPGPFDFISAWDSIWHLPLSEQEPVLKRILASLAPGGVCIFTTGGLDVPNEKVDTAMGPPMYYSVLGIPKTLAVLSEAGCICRHLEYDQFPELHVFLIVQKK